MIENFQVQRCVPASPVQVLYFFVTTSSFQISWMKICNNSDWKYKANKLKLLAIQLLSTVCKTNSKYLKEKKVKKYVSETTRPRRARWPGWRATSCRSSSSRRSSTFPSSLRPSWWDQLIFCSLTFASSLRKSCFKALKRHLHYEPFFCWCDHHQKFTLDGCSTVSYQWDGIGMLIT